MTFSEIILESLDNLDYQKGISTNLFKFNTKGVYVWKTGICFSLKGS